MQETTLRFHTYQARAEEHTQRDEDVIAAENAAHPDRWIDPEAHKELGAALDAYNAKQTRRDRRMTMEQYRENVRQDPRGQKNKAIAAANKRAEAEGRVQDIRKEKGKCTSVEVVFSLGNAKPLRDENGHLVLDAQGMRQTPGRIPGDVAEVIFKDYIAGFQARNRNFFLYSAMEHTGEWARVKRGGEDITVLGGPPGQWVRGVDHLHMGMIVWAEGYQQGLSRQVSTGKGLAAMGFKGVYVGKGKDKKMVKSPWTQWQEREQEIIAGIARQYGYEIVPGDERETSLAPSEYQKLAELEQDALDALADAKDEAASIKAGAETEAAEVRQQAKDDAKKTRRRARADAAFTREMAKAEAGIIRESAEYSAKLKRKSAEFSARIIKDAAKDIAEFTRKSAEAEADAIRKAADDDADTAMDFINGL